MYEAEWQIKKKKKKKAAQTEKSWKQIKENMHKAFWTVSTVIDSPIDFKIPRLVYEAFNRLRTRMLLIVLQGRFWAVISRKKYTFLHDVKQKKPSYMMHPV